ncbi:hypothetical protein [Mycoplasmopsis arginini]|uniref:hypothetical protein n=1 Tax=Mycoplasmopsis arginini TaxID=2094 RepID=UPI0002D19826|nr:hypothetical protein [Mycoplasmopsis arginini]ENY69234.1 Hypothetical protein, predicted transmembrane protein [Mycoplasmopsis arginini 7264]
MINSNVSPSLLSTILFYGKKSKKRNVTLFLSLIIKLVFYLFLILDIIIFSTFLFSKEQVSFYLVSKIVILFLSFITLFLILVPLTNNLLKSSDFLKDNNKHSIGSYLIRKNNEKQKISHLLQTQFWINILFNFLYFLAIGFSLLANFIGLYFTWAQNIICTISGFILFKNILFDDILIPLLFTKISDKKVAFISSINLMWITLTFLIMVLTSLILSILDIFIHLGWNELIITIFAMPIIFFVFYIIKVMTILLINRKNLNRFIYVSAFLIAFSYQY